MNRLQNVSNIKKWQYKFIKSKLTSLNVLFGPTKLKDLQFANKENQEL